MIKLWFHQNNKPETSSKREQASTPGMRGPDPPCSDLWDLVLDMKWDRVIEHTHRAPQDAAWQDGHWDETPLYLACQQSSPVPVIKAIVRAHPAALLVPSRANHDVPLHIACRYQAPVEVLDELLRDFPETSLEQTRWGSLPIMALWEFRSKVMSLDEEKQFWEKVRVLLSAVARCREDPRLQDEHFALSSSSSSGQLQIRSSNPQSLRNKEALDEELQQLLALHAAVSLGALRCPVEILQHVLQRWSYQFNIKDQWGQLPLHIAVGPSSWSSATRRKYKPREQPFIRLLLQDYPEAASIRMMIVDHGRYPLHSAIANRHSWSGGVQELFLAAPHVLLVQDPWTKLYPFQLAAIPVRDTVVELDTIYHLLRARPDVLTFIDIAPGQSEITMKAMLPQGPRLDTFIGHCDGILIGAASAILVGSAAALMFSQ
jgi:hypothetical protein